MKNEFKFNKQVLCGFQFIERSPLGFFEFKNNDDATKIFNHKKDKFEACGKIVVKNDGFKPTRDANGNFKANENLYVVTRAKTRPVLIFQDIEFCEKYHDNVFVIPIQTLKKPEIKLYKNELDYIKDKKMFDEIVNRNDKYYNKYYNKAVNSNGQIRHRILILSDACFVHKSTLFGTVKDSGLTSDDIITIQKRLSRMLNIEELEKCSNCKFSYENYKEQKLLENAVDEIAAIDNLIK